MSTYLKCTHFPKSLRVISFLSSRWTGRGKNYDWSELNVSQAVQLWLVHLLSVILTGCIVYEDRQMEKSTVGGAAWSWSPPGGPGYSQGCLNMTRFRYYTGPNMTRTKENFKSIFFVHFSVFLTAFTMPSSSKPRLGDLWNKCRAFRWIMQLFQSDYLGLIPFSKILLWNTCI